MSAALNRSCDIRQLRGALLAWYDQHARRLPWRETGDPYRVWLSEIMLQQTRVAAVIEHYHEFLRRFPTVQKLACARQSAVLAAWSGLGYYRRARMLHAAAKTIVREHAGKFPDTAEGLRALPGIGRYTSAAIASIAFGESIAVVDGNVERVLGRVLGRPLENGDVWKKAQEFLDHSRPGDFNQAMMELGATVCTPRSPTCLACPVIGLCAARGETPSTKKAPRQRKREIHYALHERDGCVCLVQRKKTASLMPGMWELPEIDSPAQTMNPRKQGKLLFTVKHSITVTNYTVAVWRASRPATAQGTWVSRDRLPTLALTGLARKILHKAKILPSRAPSRANST